MHALPDLPYAHNVLEPTIDARTMEIHHGKHHQVYVNMLNAALDGHDDLASLSVEDLLRGIDNVLFGFAAAAGVVTAHCAYEVYFTVRRGATVGKSMAGLRIVNSDSYGPLSVAAAVRRHLLLHAAPPIGGAIAVTQFEPTDVRAWAVIAAGVGCWALIGASPAWDPQRRGWHDRAAGSIVVRADSVPADTWSPPPQPPQPPSTPPSPPARPRAEPPKWGLVSDYDKPPDEQSGTHPATCPSEHRHSIANPRPSN